MPDEHRSDIQVLRGLAVTLVVLFHSNAVSIRAGYLGVDIFFVISGFLITSHIIKNVDRGIFSLSHFYLRRARRLLPATYCTLFFTTLGAVFFLTPSAWADYIKSLFGALTFTANIVLWQQSGYFEEAASSKPLLHLWSLSIEEQYYLLLPLLLLMAPRRGRTLVIAAALLFSAAICIYVLPYRPFTFFLLPTRVWELLVGSLFASLMADGHRIEIPTVFKVAAAGAIVVIPFFPLDRVHPRWDAVIVCCATATIISSKSDWLRLGLVTKGLSLVGDWSYSIYLVHWPLYAFASNAFLGSIPTRISLLLILPSFALGYLQWRCVEQPFRVAWSENNRRYFRYVGIAFLIVALPIPAYLAAPSLLNGAGNFVELRRVNRGLDLTCAYGATFDDRPKCRLPGEPRVALWGDSFAMHWAAGLADVLKGRHLVQLTKSACGPLQGLAIIEKEYPREFARTCNSFNDSVVKYLTITSSIKTVLLAGIFSPYLSSTSYLVGDEIEEARVERLRAKFLETISTLRQAGKRVAIIAPPPRPGKGLNVGECLERKARGLVVFLLGRSDCAFDYAGYRANSSRLIALLRDLESEVQVIWPESVMCSGGMCLAKRGDTLLYRDDAHLTYEGSILIARMLPMAAILGQ